MKRAITVLMVIVLMFLFVGCSEVSEQLQETFTTEAPTETETSTEADPPFFKNDYSIDGTNTLQLMAGNSDNGVIVSVDCKIDGSNKTQGSVVFAYILANCISVASNVSSLVLTVTDTSTNESGYTMFLHGEIMLNQTPSFYDSANTGELDADLSSLQMESIDNAFDELNESLKNQ